LEPLVRQKLGADIGVGVVGVSGVDDQVPVVQEGDQFADDGVNGRPGRDEQHDGPGHAKHGDECPYVRRRAHIPVLGFMPQHLDLDLVVVISRHRESVPGHVQQEIASHDAQADHADLTQGLR
jgi:hypothetical protein